MKKTLGAVFCIDVLDDLVYLQYIGSDDELGDVFAVFKGSMASDLTAPAYHVLVRFAEIAKEPRFKPLGVKPVAERGLPPFRMIAAINGRYYDNGEQKLVPVTKQFFDMSRFMHLNVEALVGLLETVWLPQDDYLNWELRKANGWKPLDPDYRKRLRGFRYYFRFHTQSDARQAAHILRKEGLTFALRSETELEAPSGAISQNAITLRERLDDLFRNIDVAESHLEIDFGETVGEI